MLSIEQLNLIRLGLAQLPDVVGADALERVKEIISGEIAFQAASAPLMNERYKILGRVKLSQEDEARLEVLGFEISEIAASRPVEFGSLTAEDFRVMNIVNRVARHLE